MNQIRLRIHVAPDHSISGTAPAELQAGVHEVTIATPRAQPPEIPFRMADLPVWNGPWDDRISLRREDMYGDDGS